MTPIAMLLRGSRVWIGGIPRLRSCNGTFDMRTAIALEFRLEGSLQLRSERKVARPIGIVSWALAGRRIRLCA